MREEPRGSIFLLLEETEQLDLGEERQAVGLVQQKRAALGLAHDAVLLVGSTRVRGALMSEKLVLHEIRRDGAAVDGQEGLAGAGAELVDRPCDQLLAGSGLARDQDARVVARNQGDLLDHGQERRALSDERPQSRYFLQPLVLRSHMANPLSSACVLHLDGHASDVLGGGRLSPAGCSRRPRWPGRSGPARSGSGGRRSAPRSGSPGGAGP